MPSRKTPGRDPETGRPVSDSGMEPELIGGRIQVVRDAHFQAANSRYPATTAERVSSVKSGGIGNTLGDFVLGNEFDLEQTSDGIVSTSPAKPLTFSGADSIIKTRFRSLKRQQELGDRYTGKAPGNAPAASQGTQRARTPDPDPELLILGWTPGSDQGGALRFPDAPVTGVLKDIPGGMIMLRITEGEVPSDVKVGSLVVCFPAASDPSEAFRAGSLMSRMKAASGDNAQGCILMLQRDLEQEHSLLHNAGNVPVEVGKNEDPPEEPSEVLSGFPEASQMAEEAETDGKAPEGSQDVLEENPDDAGSFAGMDRAEGVSADGEDAEDTEDADDSGIDSVLFR